MLKAVNVARESGGIGTWYPSPSEYDPHAFLSTLSDNVADDIERRHSRDTRMRHFWRAARPIIFITYFAFIAGMISLAATGFVRLSSLFRPNPDSYAIRYTYIPRYRAYLPGYLIRQRLSSSSAQTPITQTTPSSFPRRVRFYPSDRLDLQGGGIGTLPAAPFLCRDLDSDGCTKKLSDLRLNWGKYDDKLRAYISMGERRLSALYRRADRSFTILVIAIAGAAAMFVYALFRGLLATRRSRRLLREATLMRERIRYSATQREAREVGAEVGRGLIGRFRASRERELVERPTTLSSLIHDFRALVERAGEVSGPIVIAIDELDKMTDPDKVRALLRDIKGIFDVPGVSFLVSVSDEAVRALSLGALSDKNEFNSSFYTVLELPPLPPWECVGLLKLRKVEAVDEVIVRALAVIAAGNPRELLRLTDFVLSKLQTRSLEWQPLSHALATAMRAEAIEFRRQVIATTATYRSPKVTDDERKGAFEALSEASFQSPGAFLQLADRALSDELWTPRWADRGWDRHFADEWRTLLVRLHICGHLLRHQEELFEDQRVVELQQMTSLASLSAVVARTVVEHPAEHASTLVEPEATPAGTLGGR